MKHIGRLIGLILTIVAVAFFVSYVSRQLQGLEPGTWSRVHWSLLFIAFSVYIGHAFLHPVAWKKLLGFTGHQATYPLAASILFESQFAKYVPGNVAQPMGRIFLARSQGIGVGAATLTLAVEAAWVAATGTVMALFGGAAEAAGDGILPAGWGTPILVLAVATALILPFTLPGLVKRLVARIPQFKRVTLPDFRPTVPGTLLCLAVYTINFIVIGSMTWLIAAAIGVGSAPFAAVMVCSITGWLVGFLTPGSPAGAGIRDSIIVLGLSAVMPAPEAALVALLHRLLTASGDFVLFLIGKGIKRRIQ